MTDDGRRRRDVLEAAAAVYAERSIANAGKREIARRAGTSVRAVSEVGAHRIDLLRQIVELLPFPPVARRMADQADEPVEAAVQALLAAAREVLGDPATAWDPLELQALAVAPYDEQTKEVVRARLDQRWDAAEAVIRQLRGSVPYPPVDDAAATLHLMSVGLGLALLAPLSRRWSDPRAWTALSARLLEAVSAADVDNVPVGDEVTWRVRVAVPDSPSVMARMTRVMSMVGANVDMLFTEPVTEGRQIVHAIFRSSPQVGRIAIVGGLESVGTDVIVARGTSWDTNDIATRVLQLSARVAADPSLAPRAAADLVLADSWEVLPASAGPDASPVVLRLQWTLDHHVILRRQVAPFTPHEQLRASALLDLVAAVAEARGEEQFGWREPLSDGSTVIVRLARPEDAASVEEMHERASANSRYQRYFTPMSEWREENLRRISGEHRGATLVVTDQQDQVVALGNVFPVGPQSTTEAEIALIVEDDWQGRGVGRILLQHLVDVARRLRFESVVAYVLAENRAMLGLLETVHLQWTSSTDPDLGPAVVRRTAAL